MVFACASKVEDCGGLKGSSVYQACLCESGVAKGSFILLGFLTEKGIVLCTRVGFSGLADEKHIVKVVCSNFFILCTC